MHINIILYFKLKNIPLIYFKILLLIEINLLNNFLCRLPKTYSEAKRKSLKEKESRKKIFIKGNADAVTIHSKQTLETLEVCEEEEFETLESSLLKAASSKTNSCSFCKVGDGKQSLKDVSRITTILIKFYYNRFLTLNFKLKRTVRENKKKKYKNFFFYFF